METVREEGLGKAGLRGSSKNRTIGEGRVVRTAQDWTWATGWNLGLSWGQDRSLRMVQNRETEPKQRTGLRKGKGLREAY